MILLNYSHPLGEDQRRAIENLIGQQVARVVEQPVQFDNQAPFQTQLEDLMSRLPLSPEELETQPILVNLPALNFIAALVLAALHGRMGYFPAILRTRPVEGSLPIRYEVAEILNLQSVRDWARKTRGPRPASGGG